MSDLFDRHRETLDRACAAIRDRTCHSAYPEVPSGRIYGEEAAEAGAAAHAARLGRPFALPGHPGGAVAGEEISPFTGEAFGIAYPRPDAEAIVAAAGAAQRGWRGATPEERVGVCLEALHRLNRRSFEMAHAVMHTTGQGFMMAFQAGGPHAQDRGLEALAYAWEEMHRTPERATWTKRVGKEETVTLEKTFRIVPRGIGLVIACSTFPTWNGYPAIFADLATGNAVVVKPHPGAVLPLALTVAILREVLAESGFDPNVVLLATDRAEEPIAAALATHPAIGIVDYTGGPAFGAWLEQHATQAVVLTEKAGVNSAILDSCGDLRGVSGNLAFSVSLFSGQMCTTSQNIFIPRDGIETPTGRVAFADVAAGLVKAVDGLLGEPKRAAEILGAIRDPGVIERVEAVRREAEAAGGRVLREPGPAENPAFPNARVRGPLVVAMDEKDEAIYGRERFGPVVCIVATESTERSIEIAARLAREQGAITCALWSLDEETIRRAEEATAEAGVPLSVNLAGSIWVNQSAAFSDFHVSGANPAGNATLCDGAFVSGRFRVVQSRIFVPSAVPAPA